MSLDEDSIESKQWRTKRLHTKKKKKEGLMNQIFKNDSAQAGGLWTVVSGIFIAGFFIVAFGAIMNQFQLVNNDMISSDMPYSQDHYNSMDLLFKYWWGLPIFVVVLYVIYGIKNALTKRPGEV